MENENENLEANENENEQTEELEGLQKNAKQEDGTENEEDNSSENKEEETVPESYDFKNVQLPEGYEFDEELADEFSSVAKEIGLSQAKANKLIEFSPKFADKINAKIAETFKEAQANQIKAYKTMLNTDPEIGGAKLKEALQNANEAYNAFMTDEAAELLAQTGLNNHPAIVKVFMEIGKQVKEDSITGGPNRSKERTASDWYPEMNKNK